MSTYVISDIHGYLSRFFDVLDKAHFNWNKDELYILGDIIDRGPESADALQWIMEEAPSNIHMLCGNHEDMAYRSLLTIQDTGSVEDYIWDDPWSWNGGVTTLDALREERGSDWCHKAAQWIRQLPLYFIKEVNGMKILMVHAGIETGSPRFSDDFIETGRQDYVDIPGIGEVWAQHLLWIRERWFYNITAYPYDYIIFGHSPTTFTWWKSMIDYYQWEQEVFPEQTFPHIAVMGEPGKIVRLAGYGNGHMRCCIDTGRRNMGLLRLDDMQEFYSDLEIEND